MERRIGLLDYSIESPVSTGVNFDSIQAPAKGQWSDRDMQYSIGAQPEYAIAPKGNFPGITKKLNDTMFDMAMGSSSALKLLRPAVGRVVTNLVRPVSYNVKQKLDIIKDAYLEAAGPVKGHPHSGLYGKNYKVKAKHPLKGLKGLLKSIIDDKPIYKDAQSLDYIAREVPYRAMFDLKPRFGKAAYSNIDDFIKQNRSGSFDIVNEVSFNPNTVIGKKNLMNVVDEVEFPNPTSWANALKRRKWGPGRAHITMGDFLAKRRRDLPSGEVTGLDYKDVWDFGINKGEGLADPYKFLYLKNALNIFAPPIVRRSGREELGSVFLRKLADSITNPVTIKGTVPKDIYDDVVKAQLKRGE